MSTKYVLALDQGTTSSRAVLFHTDWHGKHINRSQFQKLLCRISDFLCGHIVNITF